jgi:serine/threonine protein phosphatase 1
MATYVISDIHGQYGMFMDLLNKINLKDSDILYILGDILDRGPHPMKTLLKIMEMSNAICLVGNHELMALECLDYLDQEVTDEALEKLDRTMWYACLEWKEYNGGDTTIEEFRKLNSDTRRDVIAFLKDFLAYEELTVDGTNYLLVHAGLGHYSPGKALEEYSLNDLIWERVDYNIQYFDDKFVVTGHTPTQGIEGNSKPGYIYRANKHIAIDCGSFIPGGRLAALCLETGEEFYSE